MMAENKKFRLAVMTFVYEADREIAFEMLESVVRSCGNADIDVFLTDDGSPSRLGEKIVSWGRANKVPVYCQRDEQNRGFRGAVFRTVSLLKVIAEHNAQYDLILRIDTDALVIKDGLGHALSGLCTDPVGLYGVVQYMRPKDRIGFLLDLMPIGLKRVVDRAGRVGQKFRFSRFSPVWWSSFAYAGLLRGFRFGFVQGSCYFLGGELPRRLLEAGYLDSYRDGQFGLITSEEDVIVSLMCKAAGVQLHEIDLIDSTWRHVNSIGAGVLERSQSEIPYVIHPLKVIPEQVELRMKIKGTLPFFVDKTNV